MVARQDCWKARVQLTFEHVELTSPTNFDEIYTAVTRDAGKIRARVSRTAAANVSS